MSGPGRNRQADAHQAAVKHLDALAPYSEFSDDEEPDPEARPETAGPWCGCSTCEVREAIAAAWPHALAAAADLVAGQFAGAAAVLYAEADRATLAGQETPA